VYGGDPNVYRGMTCPNSTRRTVHGHFRAAVMTPDRAVVSGDREFASYNGLASGTRGYSAYRCHWREGEGIRQVTG